MCRAVYAGMFDPLTLGHWWMIEEGHRLFDHLTVAVAVNPEKNPTFGSSERLAMIRETVEGQMALTAHHVQVVVFDSEFLVNYARSLGVRYILRGIRNASDFQNEQAMRNINRDLAPDIETVFLMPPRDIAEVSSSMVKGLIGPKGWQAVVRRYVTEPVYRRILSHFDKESYGQTDHHSEEERARRLTCSQAEADAL